MGHHNHRTVTTLQAVTRLTLNAYRCRNKPCPRFHEPTRPEEEGGWALPHGQFGLDVIALVGTLRYQQQRSTPQNHEELVRRGLQVAQCTATDQLSCYKRTGGMTPGRFSSAQGAACSTVASNSWRLMDYNRIWGMMCYGSYAIAVQERCW